MSADPKLFIHEVQTSRAHRERALLQARVSYAGGSMSFPCLVTQISATDAKIAVNEQTAIPENFQIAIPQRGIDCGARLVWRRADHAGIAFKVAPAAEAAGDASQNPDARLRALETENKALRATIVRLAARLDRFVEGY